MGILQDLTGTGEQKIIVSARKLISNSQRASKMLDGVINGSSNIEKIHDLKTESYEEVFRFSNSITSGAISPNLIPDMLQLVGLEYKIVDMIWVLSRAFTRYKMHDPAHKRYVRDKIGATNELVKRALAVLYEMHSTNSIDEVKRLRSRVKLIEEEGDEIKEELLNYAYSTKADFKTFYHITDTAYISDNVLDACEDTADMLLSIMLSIAT